MKTTTMARPLPDRVRQVSETESQPEIADVPTFDQRATPDFSATDFRRKSIARLRLLWDERRLLAKAATIGLAFGTLLALVLPNGYQSAVQLMPPDSQSGSGMAMLAAVAARTGNGFGAVAGDLLGVQSSGDLFVGILRSRTVQDRLVQRFDLRKAYRVRLGEDARRRLADNTGIGLDRKSGIITISVSDSDPKRATAMAQAYVEELDRLVAELSTSAAHRERIFLAERLQAVKRDLDQASKDFSQFASKNAAIDIKEQGRAMVEAAATLQGQLIAAESEMKGLEQIYTPGNVRVRSVQARVAELRRQLEKLGGQGSGDAGPSVTTDGAIYPSLRQLPILGVTYADLMRRTKVQEVVYETLTQEYELAKVQEAKETPSVKVLDTASVPERKSYPPRLLIILWSVFFALGGSAVWVFLQARWQQTDSNDPGKVLAREVFHSFSATMPWAPPNGSRLQAATHRAWIRWVRRADPARDSQ